MKIETGKGVIPLLSLIAIWSISLVVNLPGLAITPILSNIKEVFPLASELEVQLLTILPNLFIIPFVLLSGRLSVSRNKVILLAAGLAIYMISGALYFLAKTMPELIIISCLLGIGAGMVIPIAAGFIADYFTGKYRMKQLGIKSGIANAALVLATFVVGILAKDGWRMPFIVYLLPAIPLLLTPFLAKRVVERFSRKITGGSIAKDIAEETKNGTSDFEPEIDSSIQGDKIDWRKLSGIMILYGVITYAVAVINYYLPFLAERYHINDTYLGAITSVFFIAIMVPGFILPLVIRFLKRVTIPMALLFLCCGLFVGYVARNGWVLALSAGIMGLGYGIMQPIIYDKAVEAAGGKKATLSLALVLATNYFAVTVAPFVVDFFKYILHIKGNLFPYLLNALIIALLLIMSIAFIKRFTFAVNKEYIQQEPE